MPEEKPSQSFSISGSQLSDVQIGGIADNDMNVTQNKQIGTSESSKSLTQADVVELIIQLEELFRSAGLPEAQTAKAIKEAGETVDAGTSLWQKMKPILETINLWLGVATSFLI